MLVPRRWTLFWFHVSSITKMSACMHQEPHHTTTQKSQTITSPLGYRTGMKDGKPRPRTRTIGTNAKNDENGHHVECAKVRKAEHEAVQQYGRREGKKNLCHAHHTNVQASGDGRNVQQYEEDAPKHQEHVGCELRRNEPFCSVHAHRRTDTQTIASHAAARSSLHPSLCRLSIPRIQAQRCSEFYPQRRHIADTTPPKKRTVHSGTVPQHNELVFPL